MHRIAILIASHAAAFGLGYAVRGWVRRELAAGYAVLNSWSSRLESALYKGESELRAEVSKLLGEIRAKL